MELQPIRVVLADDHPIVRAGIEHTLQTAPRLNVVGTAATFEDLLRLLNQQNADVVVLDISGMGETPLAMVAQLTHRFPEVAIVTFSSTVDLAPELMQAGVRGSVVKQEVSEHLVEAIQAAYAQQAYISPVTQNYLDRVANIRASFRFTPQEFTILKLLSQGLSTEEIGQVLVIGEGSVYNYLSTIRDKTGIRQRTQLVNFYRRLTGDGLNG